MIDLPAHLTEPGRRVLAGMPEGFDALVLAGMAKDRPVMHIARDDSRMAVLAEALAFFAPGLEVVEVPAWDTVPYDRVSPNPEVLARRIESLSRLAADPERPRLILTTVSSVLQRVPARALFADASFAAKVGDEIDVNGLLDYLSRNGYSRSEQVMEPGEYAVRGGIVDLYPPSSAEPLRLDLFGDEIDAIRTFDPMSQRTTGTVEALTLAPMSEVVLDDGAIARFRKAYRELFGAVAGDDPLYEAISEGVKFPGMEHWLPLFHDGLDTLFAHAHTAAVTLDPQFEEAETTRLEMIAEYYEARRGVERSGTKEAGLVYHPVPPDRLYLDKAEFERLLRGRPVAWLTPFGAPDEAGETETLDLGGRPGRDFGDVRAQPDRNVYDALREHVVAERQAGRRVAVAAYTAGSRDRLASVMREHAIPGVAPCDDWAEAASQPAEALPLVVLGLEHGFTTPDLAVIAEPDILGDRLARPARKRKRKSEGFIADISTLNEGDVVVHAEHGIGRYKGLETLQVGGAPHDCLRLVYHGDDKLFVPVENLDVLTRFGSEDAEVQLDKLGSAAWQARKAKAKERIRDMAERLIAIAAQRQMKAAERVGLPEGLYDEFCARFPYVETDDQMRAIGDTLEDLTSGRAMDRLVCGDVGFGKTEVALRTAFAAAMSGLQVAVVVPTTLLARQHYMQFRERFAGFPLKVGQLSRLVTGKAATEVKQGLKSGDVNVVVGTHALLAKSIEFSNLGLLIVDEEQHFGVAHKERLKQLKSDVHVLTLTATPIPRTLQLALTGVKELSVIATPPVDRLAVRTFVLPFDGVVIREAVLREKFRGGQTFYVCPRIQDMDRVEHRLKTLVPEIRMVKAHGRMPAKELEEVMTAFADGEYDVLLSTNIIESGLDMPRVNTIVVHRADMFGLAQLYQLRGRVGRAKARGYAYLTLPQGMKLTKTAERRLQVMQTLDSLGAGFSLASHDMDIRGAGNLLGEEQSGHVREVGIELYQRLLEEAVAAAKEGGDVAGAEEKEAWSPQIAIGTPVLIPEDYVADLGVRLSLYRRIAAVSERDETDRLAAELVDRFGPLPPEVENLLDVVGLKVLCRTANVEKIDAGPKGAVIAFRDNEFPNPAGLVEYIGQQLGTVKVKGPDHKLVFTRNLEREADRIPELKRIMSKLAEIAAAG